LPRGPDREHTPPPASDPTDAAPQGEAREKFETGGRSKKLTKSLTAKTTKTRYRDPLPALGTPRFLSRKPEEKESEAKAVKRKFRKSLTGKTRQTKHRVPLKTSKPAEKQEKKSEATVKRKSQKVFDSKDETD